MENWEYSFSYISKDEWMAQIKKDLKNASIDSLASEWWPGESITPFHHADDSGPEQVRLPDKYFSASPLISEWIDISSDQYESLNKNILISLRRGAQSIICFFDSPLYQDLHLLTKDVQLDIIEFAIQCPLSQVKSLKEFPASTNSKLRIERSNEPFTQLFETSKEIAENTSFDVQYAYTLHLKENWIEQATQLLNNIREDFIASTKSNNHQINFLQRCRLIIYPDPSFFKLVVQLRVLQLLWLNLCKEFNTVQVEEFSPIECHLTPDMMVDPDKYLITAAASSLAASITGVRSICIHRINSNSVPDYYHRIDLNIQHLLNLESEMYQGQDPISGSYALDFYTRKWTEKIWKKVGGWM